MNGVGNGSSGVLSTSSADAVDTNSRPSNLKDESPSTALTACGEVAASIRKPLCEAYFPEGSLFQDTSDVVLVVEGRELLAHRAFLALHSEVLRNALNDTGGGGSCRAGSRLVLKDCLVGIPLPDMLLLMRFMYCQGQSAFLKQLEPEQLMKLAVLSDRFVVPHLQAATNQHIQQAVESGSLQLSPTTQEEGVLKWLLLAERHKLPWLLARCEQLLLTFLPQLQADPRMDQLSSATWQRLAAGLGHYNQRLRSRRRSGRCTLHNRVCCTEAECVRVLLAQEVALPPLTLLMEWQEAPQPSGFKTMLEWAGGTDTEEETEEQYSYSHEDSSVGGEFL